MTLAEYLRANGISQAAFASQIGLSEPSISRLVKGRQRPNLDTLLAIEKATDGQVTASGFASVAKPVEAA